RSAAWLGDLVGERRAVQAEGLAGGGDRPGVGAVEQGAAAERPELVGQRQPPAAGGGAADGLGGGGDLGVGHDVALLGRQGSEMTKARRRQLASSGPSGAAG